jgi:hypothetical protein
MKKTIPAIPPIKVQVLEPLPALTTCPSIELELSRHANTVPARAADTLALDKTVLDLDSLANLAKLAKL